MDTPILVLAGGLGTRLRSVTGEKPKILAPMGERPFLAYFLKFLAQEGGRRIVFSLGYGAADVKEALASLDPADYALGFSWETVTETEPLGTGGAIRWACREARISGRILVCNGDTVATGSIAALLNPNLSVPSIALTSVTDISRYGEVVQAGDGKVLAFREKTPVQRPGWIYSGVAALDTADFLHVSKDRFSLETDYFREQARRGKLNGVQVPGEFIDIGIPEDYRRFREEFASRYL